MIRAKIELPKYRWKVRAYIAVSRYYTDDILNDMEALGASKSNLADAYRNLSSGQLNNGLTYTNSEKRETIWVVALTSSAREFMDSVVHEIRHLEQHIANECGIDENSEEACYLCGDIAYRLFPYCKKLLCEHCRCE